MNTALARIAAFVVGLAVVFAGGLAVGSAVGPDVEPVAGHDGAEGHASTGHGAGTRGRARLVGRSTVSRSRSSSTAPASPPGPIAG